VATLGSLSKLIRSKNAGPFELTIDIMFDEEKNYRRVKESNIISSDLISKLYNISNEKIRITNFDAAYSIKITIPRPTISGSSDDTDVYGGQQYGPLVELEIP
jgi:DnaJ-class molecular chaperone